MSVLAFSTTLWEKTLERLHRRPITCPHRTLTDQLSPERVGPFHHKILSAGEAFVPTGDVIRLTGHPTRPRGSCIRVSRP